MLRVRTDVRRRLALRFALVAVCFSLLGSPALGRAAVLCGKKNTTTGELLEGTGLHVRSECKSTEIQASLSALGLQPKFAVRSGNTITTNGSLSTPATCQPGEIATGGGVLATGANGGVPAMRSSRPLPDDAGAVPTSWRTTVGNVEATGTITATAYVVCAAP
jgi:hypothetical protein